MHTHCNVIVKKTNYKKVLTNCKSEKIQYNLFAKIHDKMQKKFSQLLFSITVLSDSDLLISVKNHKLLLPDGTFNNSVSIEIVEIR